MKTINETNAASAPKPASMAGVSQVSGKKIAGNALKIFFGMLIILTFFSNTINNFTIPRVTAELPMPGDIVKDIRGEGVVEANVIQEIYAFTEAMVKEVKVSPGDYVEQGQSIMVLDTRELEASLKDETAKYNKLKLQLEKQLEKGSSGKYSSHAMNVLDAENKLEQKQKAFNDISELYRLGAESGKNLEEAQADLEAAKLEYEAAKYNSEAAARDNKRDLDSLRYDMEIQKGKVEELREKLMTAGVIQAPFDGIITGINFAAGTMVNSSKPLFTAVDTAKGFRLKVVLDAEKAKYLTVGETADVIVGNAASGRIKGEIAVIADNMQQKGEKKDVYISIEMEGLAGGEAGEASFRKRIQTRGLLVSNDAIRTDARGEYLLTVREREGALGKEYYVEENRITTGESDSEKTAVIEGVVTDLVVIKSSKAIRAGDRVLVEK